MAASGFDPYETWLEIPPAEQPPNHYRLLGVAPFENNAHTIHAAADRCMAHVRKFQSGARGLHTQPLLNEIAQARRTLTEPALKTQYDRRLRAEAAAAGKAAAEVPLPAAPKPAGHAGERSLPSPPVLPPPADTILDELELAENSSPSPDEDWLNMDLTAATSSGPMGSPPGWAAPNPTARRYLSPRVVLIVGGGALALGALLLFVLAAAIVMHSTRRQRIAGLDDDAQGFVLPGLGQPAPPERLEPREWRQIFRAPTKSMVTSLALSNDGRLLAVGSFGQSLQLFDVERQAEVAALEPPDNLGQIEHLAFSQDRKRLLVGCESGRVLVYGVNEVGQLTLANQFKHPVGPLGLLVISPDDRHVLTTGQRHRLVCWTLDSGREQWSTTRFTEELKAVSFAPDGATILATDAQRLWRFDLASGRTLEYFELEKVHGGQHSAAFSADGRRVAAGRGPAICCWNVADGNLVSVCVTPKIQYAMTFFPDGRRLFSGGPDWFWIIDTAAGKSLSDIREERHIGSFVACSDDGRRIAANCDRNAVHVFEVTN